ncbi:hypothetical protein BFJ69_g16107 [Fusarium oxysporum]|uniref:MULE transposase domain-containing protein n=1 Tax=Fusarium oxysporum TaxID=5507 RepID=A0A420MC89_FUSOX|nr:hypothetical protein BFJ69_g16107 [Fusarium oxysporum]
MNVNQSQSPTPFPGDCLPPEGEYESREALFEAINAWAATRGYAFITRRSTKEKTGRRTITYMCDRRRNHPIVSRERQRKTTTRTTGCEFSVLAKENNDRSTWTLRHRSDSRFSLHNHEPSQDTTALPVLRTLSKEHLSQLTGLTNAGIAPKEIRTYMRQNLDTIATQQDIYNRIADARREVCQGQSCLIALADQLFREGFWSQFQTGPDGRVKAVLFAHPESVAYLQAYPDVLILDCTYKTNKYGMPLLDLIGVDSCQRSFCVAFAFLSGECEEDYFWALDRFRSLCENHRIRHPSVSLTDRCLACMNAVDTCFPSSRPLLCLWHANKAVVRYCQPRFTRQTQGDNPGIEAWNEFYGHWHSIIKSPNEQTFHERVSEFEKKYLPDYIEKLVKAWVNRHPHFDNVVTSRVEGIHWLFKSHLKVSTLDLFEAWRSIKHALLNQLAELKSNQVKQKIRTPIELSSTLYGAVRGWVSHEALRKVEQQRKLLLHEDSGPMSACTGSFSRSQGLPCAHKLKGLLVRDQALQLEDFHPHWHLTRKDNRRPLLEPRQRVDPVAASSSLPLSSVRRELSGFEVIENARPIRNPPLCSKCHILGHTRNPNECPLRYSELRALPVVSSDQPQTCSENFQWIPFAVPEEPRPPAMETLDEIQWQPITTLEIFEFEPELTCQDLPFQLTIETEQVDRHITTPEPRHLSPAPSMYTSPVTSQLTSGDPASDPTIHLRYDDPRAIHQRYVKSREDWYKAQSPGTWLGNRQYRKAMGLPLGYPKASYSWCLDYKQMGRYCKTSRGLREWTKEEMMAYLDWDKAETDRIEARVAEETENGRLFASRRGMGELWEMAQRDIDEQEALYSAAEQEESCIVVQP